MLSDFRRRKLIGLFRFQDLDGDGRVSAKDFEQVGNNYADLYGEPPGSPKREEAVSRMKEQWNQLKAFDFDGDGVVELEEWLAGMDAWLADREAFEAQMDALIGALYEIVDRDGDGRISEEELILNYRASGQEESAARAAFAKLDRDGDGMISKDEMMANTVELYYSEDPDAPGNWIALPEG